MKAKKILKLHWRFLISDKGFTLLEVILAIVIGSMVLTILYSSFFQVIRAKDSVENTLELYHATSIVFSKMTEDLQAAYPRGMVYSDLTSAVSLPYFIGKKEGDQSTLNFTSLSREPSTNSKDSDQAEIGYYLEPISKSDLFFLMRRENPRIGTDSSGTQYPICDRVVELNMAYVSGEELVDEWDSTLTGSLPRAVEIQLTVRGPGGEDVTFSSLILIPVGN
jgi:type II secretion system protein J